MRALWAAVLLHALGEATGRPVADHNHPGSVAQARAAAVEWFRRGGGDFTAVCDFADMSPDAVQAVALHAIDRGRPLRTTRWRGGLATGTPG